MTVTEIRPDRTDAARRPVSRLEAGLVALAAGLVALVLAAGIGVPSLWWDEIATLSAATRPLGDLLALVAQVDLVHLAYYLVMHGWLAVVPHDGFWLRLPSALAVGATVPAVYAIGRMLSSRPVAIVAAILFVALPRTGWTATEGRSFALTTLVAALVVVLFLVAARRGGAWRIVLLMAAGVAVVLLWIYAAAVLVSLLAAVPFVARSRGRRLALALGAGLPIVLTAPFVLAVVGQRGQVGGTRPVGLDLPKFVFAEQWFPDLTPVAVVFWIVVAVLVALAVLRRAVSGRAPVGRGALVLLLTWLVLPLIVVVAASRVLDHSLYQPRAFAFTTPALAVLVAIAAVRALGFRGGAVFAILLAVAATPAYAGDRLPGAKGVEWGEAAALVAAASEPTDGPAAVVFVDNRTTAGFIGEVPSVMTLAYPDAFLDLADVSLEQTPVEAANLFGDRAAPDRWPDLLAGYDRVVVVRGTPDGAPETAEADAVLTAAGFAERSAETVPGTSVEVWVR